MNLQASLFLPASCIDGVDLLRLKATDVKLNAQWPQATVVPIARLRVILLVVFLRANYGSAIALMFFHNISGREMEANIRVTHVHIMLCSANATVTWKDMGASA